MIPRDKAFQTTMYLKQVLLPDEFETFLLSSVFDKAVFCLGEKQGVLVNDDCSSWAIFCCQFGLGERKLYMAMVSVRPTPLQSARSMALSAMPVECE